MSSKAVVGGIAITRPGLNYLVPQNWLSQFCLLNRSNQASSIQAPSLAVLDHADPFLLHFLPELQEQLETKSNYLKFCSIKISLEPQKHLTWAPINPALWRIIASQHKNNHGIFTILQEKKQYSLTDTAQIRIIFCSKSRSDAFVGFLPKKANLALTLRQVGFEMGFIEVQRSKVAFLDKNPQLSFSFHELEKYSVESGPGMTFMAFNMQRKQEQISSDVGFFEKLGNESNQAVVGDLNTMQDDTNNHLNEAINNRTMSTGAQTPFSFVLSQGFDLDREYRVNELFGAKEPEQIEELKQLALKKIQGQNCIPLPIGQEQELMTHLQKLAEELIEGFLKKKTSHKEKEKEVEISFQ